MKKNEFDELLESIKQAGDIKAGKRKPSRSFAFNTPDVKAIRKKLHVSQNDFALMIGISKSTLQNWEQGRREPEGPAKALLYIAERNPKAVMEALHLA